MKRRIWCTGCLKQVEARLTDGRKMYPNRPELADLPFWVCPTEGCGASVGTHYKTRDRLKPLGFLATPEVKRWRMMIHKILDPLWMRGKVSRGRLYREISDQIGRDYHTAEIYNAKEGRQVYEIAKEIKEQFDPGPWNR